MTVSDLNFSLGVSGEREVEQALETIEDGLEDAQDAASRLDAADPDVDVDADVGGARQKLQAALNAVRAVDNEESVIDVEAKGVRSTIQEGVAAAERLDQLDADIDLGIDRDGLRRAVSSLPSGGGTSRSGGGRLPGELDEVGEAFRFFSGLAPQLQGLAAAAGTAATALGAGVGLAGVATRLAAELGPRGLQRDVKSVASTLRETGRSFASAFSGVIRSEVLPAARGLSIVIKGLSDELATFSSVVIDAIKQVPGPGALLGAAVEAGRATEEQSSADALAQGIGDVPGIRKTLTTLTQQIDRVRGKFERDLIPKEELLSQIVSFRQDAFTNLQKLQQKVPEAFPPALLGRFAAKLRAVQGRLEEVQKTTSSTANSLQASDITPTSVENRTIEQPSPNLSAPLPINQVTAARRQIRQLRQGVQNAALTMRTFQQVGVRALARVGQGVGRMLGDILTFREGISSVGDAFKKLGNVAIGVLRSVVSELASAAALAAVLGPILGVSDAGFGAIFKGVIGGGGIPGIASGGVVKEGGIARVHKGETVIPNGGAVAGRLDAGPASLDANTIEIPVRMINDGNRTGARNKRRAGRS